MKTNIVYQANRNPINQLEDLARTFNFLSIGNDSEVIIGYDEVKIMERSVHEYEMMESDYTSEFNNAMDLEKENEQLVSQARSKDVEIESLKEKIKRLEWKAK